MVTKQIKFICLFDNGNIAVCDEKGQQISSLQGNVITRIFKEAKKLGYKLNENMEILLPCGI